MRQYITLTLVLLTSLAALPAVAQPSGPISQYSRLIPDACHSTDPEIAQAGDELSLRCPGLAGVPVWAHYDYRPDRLHLGFGRRANITGEFAADRHERWPMEWRGRMQHGRFVPYAVIVRLTRFGAARGETELFVWRLREDGASCLVGEIGRGARQNERARATADRAGDGRAACDTAPVLL
jgi:hypothetical protein